MVNNKLIRVKVRANELEVVEAPSASGLAAGANVLKSIATGFFSFLAGGGQPSGDERMEEPEEEDFDDIAKGRNSFNQV